MKPGIWKNRPSPVRAIRPSGSSAPKRRPVATAGTTSRDRLRSATTQATACRLAVASRRSSIQRISQRRTSRATMMPPSTQSALSGARLRTLRWLTGSRNWALNASRYSPTVVPISFAAVCHADGRSGFGPRLTSSAEKRARTMRSISAIWPSARWNASFASRIGAWALATCWVRSRRRSAISGGSVTPSAGGSPSALSRLLTSTNAGVSALSASSASLRCAASSYRNTSSSAVVVSGSAMTPSIRCAAASETAARRVSSSVCGCCRSREKQKHDERERTHHRRHRRAGARFSRPRHREGRRGGFPATTAPAGPSRAGTPG